MKTIIINNDNYAVSDDEFDALFCEQSNGKEIAVVDGKIVAVERQLTSDNASQIKIRKKLERLSELTKDMAQVQAGLIIDNIEDRKLEFRTLLNEVRVLQGKEPRNAIDSE